MARGSRADLERMPPSRFQAEGFIEIGDYVDFPERDVESAGYPAEDVAWKPVKLLLDIKQDLNERILPETVIPHNGIGFQEVLPDAEDRAFFIPVPAEIFRVMLCLILEMLQLVKQLPFFQAHRVSFTKETKPLKQQILLPLGSIRLPAQRAEAYSAAHGLKQFFGIDGLCKKIVRAKSHGFDGGIHGPIYCHNYGHGRGF